ncbi:ice-binding family protein [Sphaerisporangium melleum]|nr:ice-binding family protein [Sphaerisporangium melleum]
MGAVIATPQSASAQAPVALGAAATFGVLAGTSVTNTGPSLVTGDLGVSPGATVTGFPPGSVTGTIHAGDAAAAQAQTALTAAYTDISGRTATGTIPAALGGTTLTPGVYNSATGPFTLTGNLTLDAQGDPNAVFILRTTGVAGSLTVAPGATVTLTGGARACNVFWQVTSTSTVAPTATIGAGAVFAGNILALTSIDVGVGAILNGRALARNGAVTLNTSQIRQPVCAGSRTAVAVTTSCADPNFHGPLTLTATVRGDGQAIPTGQVVFLVDGVSRGSATLDAQGRASITLSDLAEGEHSIVAFYPGNASFDSATSATVLERLGPGGVCCEENAKAGKDGKHGEHGWSGATGGDPNRPGAKDRDRRFVSRHHKDDKGRLVTLATVRTIEGVFGEGGGGGHRHDRWSRHGHHGHHGYKGGHKGGKVYKKVRGGHKAPHRPRPRAPKPTGGVTG